MKHTSYKSACMAPKNPTQVKRIVEYILKGLRAGMDTATLATRLNQFGILTIMKRKWTAHSLQMQILKMARSDDDSSLAWALSSMLRSGLATGDDLELLAGRTRGA